MARFKYFLWGVLFLAGSAGGSWCTLHEYQREAGLESRGKKSIASVVEYEPRDVRRRHRGPLETAHYHRIAYDGHQGSVELARQFPTGTRLEVIYDEGKPGVVRLYHGADTSGWGLWDWVWRVGGILLLLVAATGGFIGAFEDSQRTRTLTASGAGPLSSVQGTRLKVLCLARNPNGHLIVGLVLDRMHGGVHALAHGIPSPHP